MTSIYTEYNESHSRPADDSDGPWTAEQKARFAAARAVTVAMAEARRAAKVGPSVRGPECDSPDAAPAAVTALAPVATPTPTPASILRANGATPAPAPTLEQRHAQALAGFAQVQTVAKLDEWARWAKGFPFTESQEDALEDAYYRNKARLAPAPA